MDRKMIAKELLVLAKELIAIEFPTQEALDKYLKDHPDADRSNHRVVKTEKKTPVRNDAPAKADYKLKVNRDKNKKTVEVMKKGIYGIGDNKGSAQKSWFNDMMDELLGAMKDRKVTTVQAIELYNMARSETDGKHSHAGVEKELDERDKAGE